jgi:hypothetical protein
MSDESTVKDTAEIAARVAAQVVAAALAEAATKVAIQTAELALKMNELGRVSSEAKSTAAKIANGTKEVAELAAKTSGTGSEGLAKLKILTELLIANGRGIADDD